MPLHLIGYPAYFAQIRSCLLFKGHLSARVGVFIDFYSFYLPLVDQVVLCPSLSLLRFLDSQGHGRLEALNIDLDQLLLAHTFDRADLG